MKKFVCTLNFLPLATLAVMGEVLTGYERKQRDNEADREYKRFVKQPIGRKHDTISVFWIHIY